MSSFEDLVRTVWCLPDGGPPSGWEWAAVSASFAILVFALVRCVQFTWSPGEQNSAHIKNRILQEQ